MEVQPQPVLQYKILTPASFKCLMEPEAGSELKAELVVATIGIEDKDGDIFMPGSVGEQQVLLGAWGHTISRGTPAVGKALVREEGDLVLASVEWNARMPTALENWESIKFAPELVEVSMGMIPVKWNWGTNYVRELYETKWFEVSPVMMGAGVGTGVLSVKEAKAALSRPEPEVKSSVVMTPQMVEAMAWFDARRR